MSAGPLDEYGPPTGFHTPADRLTERIAEAMSRNGLNTILLDVQVGLSVIQSDLRHLKDSQGYFQEDVRRRMDAADHSRSELHTKVNANIAETVTLRATVDRIAPLVDAHERENVERAALRKAISAWMGRGRLIYGAVVAAIAAMAGWLAAHFPNIASWLHWPKPPH